MLDICAPGHWIREGPHLDTVICGPLTFPGLPKGGHDKGKEIQFCHVRKLVRRFGILECAKNILEFLK